MHIQSFQKEDLVARFVEITGEDRGDVQTLADCYGSRTVNQAKSLRLFSRMSCLKLLEILESRHPLVTVISVEMWPGAFKKINKKSK